MRSLPRTGELNAKVLLPAPPVKMSLPSDAKKVSLPEAPTMASVPAPARTLRSAVIAEPSSISPPRPAESSRVKVWPTPPTSALALAPSVTALSIRRAADLERLDARDVGEGGGRERQKPPVRPG